MPEKWRTVREKRKTKRKSWVNNKSNVKRVRAKQSSGEELTAIEVENKERMKWKKIWKRYMGHQEKENKMKGK